MPDRAAAMPNRADGKNQACPKNHVFYVVKWEFADLGRGAMRTRFEALKLMAKAAPVDQQIIITALLGMLESLIIEIEALKRRRAPDG
jgi:hypothetical protein